MSYTPGPWKPDQRHLDSSPTATWSVTSWNEDTRSRDHIAEVAAAADARLIAAAPELLEALEKALHDLSEGFDRERVCDDVRAAIAKARVP